jgi:hypothetical protein
VNGVSVLDWFFSLIARLPRPEPLPKPSRDWPNPICKSCGIALNGWNHSGVPEAVHCCRRCWSKIPIVERLKYQVMLEDREQDGPIGNLANLVRGAILRDECPTKEEDE